MTYGFGNDWLIPRSRGEVAVKWIAYSVDTVSKPVTIKFELVVLIDGIADNIVCVDERGCDRQRAVEEHACVVWIDFEFVFPFARMYELLRHKHLCVFWRRRAVDDGIHGGDAQP